MNADFEREIEQNYAAGVAMTSALQYLSRCADYDLDSAGAKYAVDVLRATVLRCQRVISWADPLSAIEKIDVMDEMCGVCSRKAALCPHGDQIRAEREARGRG